MSIPRILTIFFYFIIISSCSPVIQKAGSQSSPASNFSHIMPIIDSVAFNIMRNDSFLLNEFSFSENDTMMSSVYSLYLWGKNHFLHFSPNKGYFDDQLGTGYVIFQSKKPGAGEALKQVWQMYSKDSLVSYDFKGSDFILTEIIASKHSSFNKTEPNHLIPMLSSYTAETYKRWGLPETAESTMSDFINAVDKKVKDKLFNRIRSVDLTITNAELELLKSMLLMNGYRHLLNSFSKAGEPSFHYIVDEKSGKSKVQRINIILSEETPIRNLNLGRSGQINFGGKEAVFEFN